MNNPFVMWLALFVVVMLVYVLVLFKDINSMFKREPVFTVLWHSLTAALLACTLGWLVWCIQILSVR